MADPKFNWAQKAEVKRFSRKRKDLHSEKKLAKLPVEAIKAKVNIVSVTGGVPAFSRENNYSKEEQGWIKAWGVQSKWATEIPRRLKLAAAMKAEGAGTATIKAALNGP